MRLTGFIVNTMIQMLSRKPYKIILDRSILKKILTWFFNSPDSNLSPLSIIMWWEARRIPYNILIGIYGISSLLLFYFFIQSSGKLEPGEDAVEPMAIFVAPIVINLAYTAGWAVELILRHVFSVKSRIIGPRLLKIGVVFSLVVVSLPSIVWGCIYIIE